MNMRMGTIAGIFTLAMMALIAAPARAAPTTVYVMRHLNTPEGQRDPDLTAEGQQNAQRVRAWFTGKPLTAIYISDFRRTRQTIAPLAVERGLTPVIYDPADPKALIATIGGASGSVLIVGHSNTVPDLVEALGGDRPGPMTHPDFGDIWTIAGGKTDRVRIDLPPPAD